MTEQTKQPNLEVGKEEQTTTTTEPIVQKPKVDTPVNNEGENSNVEVKNTTTVTEPSEVKQEPSPSVTESNTEPSTPVETETIKPSTLETKPATETKVEKTEPSQTDVTIKDATPIVNEDTASVNAKPSSTPNVDIETLKDELKNIKSTLNDIKTLTTPEAKPVDNTPKVHKFEDLTPAQKADLLIYGETFTDEDGNRVANDMVIKGNDGTVHYVDEEDI